MWSEAVERVEGKLSFSYFFFVSSSSLIKTASDRLVWWSVTRIDDGLRKGHSHLVNSKLGKGSTSFMAINVNVLIKLRWDRF